MFELSTKTEFKGWKKFPDSPKVHAAYVLFMRKVGEQAEDFWYKHVPLGWEGKLTLYRMDQWIHVGEVEKEAWGYSITHGVLPVEDAKLDDADPMYPRYVDEGTGIYNLKKKGGRTFIARGARTGNFASAGSALIVPKTKKYMKFEVPLARGEEGQATIFARFTKGQRPQHITDKVEKDLNAWIRVNKKLLKAFLDKQMKAGKL